MSDDPTGTPAEQECPECKTAALGDPTKPHVHLTEYGYLVFAPNHPMGNYLEETWSLGVVEGRRRAADAIRESAARLRHNNTERPPANEVGLDRLLGQLAAYDHAADLAEATGGELKQTPCPWHDEQHGHVVLTWPTADDPTAGATP